jgi:hypothetical protein
MFVNVYLKQYFMRNLEACLWFICEPGSSVSIVPGYRLDDRTIEVRSPAEPKGFFCSLCVQTVSGAQPASCTVGTGVLFPGLKRGRGVTLTTHPHLAPRLRMSRSYTSSPPKSFVEYSGTALALWFNSIQSTAHLVPVCSLVISLKLKTKE